MIPFVKLNAGIVAPEHLCREQRRAGATERIKDKASRRGESVDERYEHRGRFLRGMKAVAGLVCPPDDIADGVSGAAVDRLWREDTRFVLVTQQSRARGVTLRERFKTNESGCSMANSATQECRNVSGTLRHRHDLDGPAFCAIDDEVRSNRQEQNRV